VSPVWPLHRVLFRLLRHMYLRLLWALQPSSGGGRAGILGPKRRAFIARFFTHSHRFPSCFLPCVIIAPSYQLLPYMDSIPKIEQGGGCHHVPPPLPPGLLIRNPVPYYHKWTYNPRCYSPPRPRGSLLEPYYYHIWTYNPLDSTPC